MTCAALLRHDWWLLHHCSCPRLWNDTIATSHFFFLKMLLSKPIGQQSAIYWPYQCLFYLTVVCIMSSPLYTLHHWFNQSQNLSVNGDVCANITGALQLTKLKRGFRLFKMPSNLPRSMLISGPAYYSHFPTSNLSNNQIGQHKFYFGFVQKNVRLDVLCILLIHISAYTNTTVLV